MRNNNKTGAGVGNVALGEMNLMQDKVAALSQAQSWEDLAARLRDAMAIYKDIYKGFQ